MSQFSRQSKHKMGATHSSTKGGLQNASACAGRDKVVTRSLIGLHKEAMNRQERWGALRHACAASQERERAWALCYPKKTTTTTKEITLNWESNTARIHTHSWSSYPAVPHRLKPCLGFDWSNLHGHRKANTHTYVCICVHTQTASQKHTLTPTNILILLLHVLIHWTETTDRFKDTTNKYHRTQSKYKF